MSNFNLERLISLLEKGEISKDELLNVMNQIQFQPVAAAPDNPPAESLPEGVSAAEKPPDVLPKELIAAQETFKPTEPEQKETAGELQGRSAIRTWIENIQNLEKAFDPLLATPGTPPDQHNVEELPVQIPDKSDEPVVRHDEQDEMSKLPLGGVGVTNGNGNEDMPQPLRLEDVDEVRPDQQHQQRQTQPFLLSERTAATPMQEHASTFVKTKAGASSCRANQRFLARIESYQNFKESRRRDRESQIREVEQQECSFQPKINKFPESYSPSRVGDLSEDFGTRLHRQTKRAEIVEQMRMEQEQREADEINENCTFQPAIYSRYARPKYMEATNEVCNMKSLSTPDGMSRMGAEGEGQCTFRPATNKVCKNMRQAREYLSIDPYTRLSQSSNKAQRILSMYGECDDEAMFEQVGSQVQSKSSLGAIQLDDFYERQRAFEAKKLEKKQKLLEEMYVEPAPKINKKSEEIAKTLVDFNERNEVLLNRNESHAMQSEDLFHKEYTFQPKILPASRGLRTKTVEEMSYAPVVQREVKLEQLKKNLAVTEAGRCPFRPNVCPPKKYAVVPSKLQLRDNIDTYMERVKLQEERKDNMARLYRQQKEYGEAVECTHKPRINELPYYMRAKLEVEARNSQILSQTKNSMTYSKLHSKNP